MNTPYRNWLDSITRPLLREDLPAVLPDELEIQSLWYQGAFGLTFQTTDGKPVTIDYLGEWNHGAGPDFLECLVTIDGEEKKGAVEIDLTPVHWELHGHAVNPSFDQVILHVSFAPNHASTYCRNSQNEEVPQVSVPSDSIDAVLEKYPDRSAPQIPGFCAEEFARWDQEEINSLLYAAAEHRLYLKAKKLSNQVSAVGIKETLWQAIATTLGYRPNQQAMRLISQRIKLKTLSQFPTMEERIAVCLGTAGFLSPELYLQAPESTQEYLKKLWHSWWKHRKNLELQPERAIPWVKAGQRPVNHPHRRVAALALLSSTLPELINAVKHPTELRYQELKKKLCSITDHFWSHQYTLTSEPTTSTLKLLGEEKFQELLVNFLIPLWYLKEPKEAFSYYLKMKTSNKNTQVKRALGRLFPSHPATRAITERKCQHQGLQQLYQDFCLRSGCLKCEFPKLNSYQETQIKNS